MSNEVVHILRDKDPHTLYAIQDEKTGLYFIWCYSDKKFATQMSYRISPVDEKDINANWRSSIRELVKSDRRDFG